MIYGEIICEIVQKLINAFPSVPSKAEKLLPEGVICDFCDSHVLLECAGRKKQTGVFWWLK